MDAVDHPGPRHRTGTGSPRIAGPEDADRTNATSELEKIENIPVYSQSAVTPVHSTLDGSSNAPYAEKEVHNPDPIVLESAEITKDIHLDTALQLVTKTLDITDDPTENPYTFRAFVIGLGLSAFGAVLAEIFYFRPQTVGVSTTFLIILSFCLGELTLLIPRVNGFTRFLNPGPFNQKEHVFIVIMASTAATCALGTEQLAAQALYFNEEPNAASAIFMLFSSQCIGYGLLSVMRRAFVYPTKFLWPTALPLAAIFQSMHLHKDLAKKRLHIFWFACLGIAVWELVPQYFFPTTIGISVFCLANPNSEFFTYLFGGANGNEGMGFLSWCMDLTYITSTPLILPLNTLVNQLIGYIGCVILTVSAYYANLWNAQTFPFLAQTLFQANGSDYNQLQILGKNNEVDPELLKAYGLPWFATSQALSLMVFNIGITAAIVHVLIWEWDEIKFVFDPLRPAQLMRRLRNLLHPDTWKFWRNDNDHADTYPGTAGDPHFAAMRAYPEAPTWWYNATLIISVVIGLICCYQQETGLPWWAFFIAVGLGWLLTIFSAAMSGIVGFAFAPTTAIQMIGGYLVPRRPVANMMFTLYGSNSVAQAIGMLGDLKMAQYAKLPPRATFASQIIGTCVGAIFNWVMMNSIVANQREVLLQVEPTNQWSGQNVQTYNAQAITWGGAGNEIFGRDGVYWMVPMGLLFGVFVPLPFWIGHRFWPQLRLDYINTFIIATWLGWLSVGINSSLLVYFLVGFLVQFYLRKYHPVPFAKWNLTVAAAISGGVAIVSFVLTFAVFGGAGNEHRFPHWWGNPKGNADHCKYMNGQ
ncbi:OPT oligopeptide transporter domain containing protein [Rhypophila sp. PSN 637]